jgi:hypothetical protein
MLHNALTPLTIILIEGRVSLLATSIGVARGGGGRGIESNWLKPKLADAIRKKPLNLINICLVFMFVQSCYI